MLSKKFLSILCAVTLLLSSLISCVSLSSFAIETGNDDFLFGKEDFFASTFNYNFEEKEEPVTSANTAADSINMTRGGDGFCVCGWANRVSNNALNIYNTSTTKTSGTGGGYRLNNKDGVFKLSKATTYVVTFDINVTGAPKTREDYNVINEATVKLGYGFSGNTSNPVNKMTTVISNVVSVYTNASTYTLTSLDGEKTYDINSGYKTVSYVFTTPSKFEGDNSLGFMSATFPGGFNCYIDNVVIRTLEPNEGIIVLKDEYKGTSSVLVGAKGEIAKLPVLESDNVEHRFEGWFTEKERLDSQKVIEPYAFDIGSVTLYSRWYAPVSITFVNTLDGSKSTVSGMPGSEITFPKKPVDQTKENWFMGWYTSSDATEKFTETVFGYSNVTLYSYWKPNAVGGKVDFENYTKDAYTVETDASGNKYKSNRYYFANTMSKNSAVTYNNSKYSVKFNWNSKMVKDANNENSYDAAGRFNNVDNVVIMENLKLDNNTTYGVKFKYFAEKVEGDVRVSPFSASSKTIWSSNRVNYRTQNAGTFITKEDVDGAWHEGVFSFTTDFNSSGTSMYILLNMDENKDAVVYLDDIEFIPVQPYESIITYNGGTGVKTHIAIGEKGDLIPKYIPEGGKSDFLGWYTDSALTKAFEGDVFPEEPITLYAKWSALPLTFEDYAFSTEPGFAFGKTTSIVNQKGIGVDDNWALRFDYDAMSVNKINDDGTEQLMNSRYNMPDHCATVMQNLTDNTVYLITYYVKTESANSDYTVRFLTATKDSIWQSLVMYEPAYVRQYTESVGNGWTKVTTAIKTQFKNSKGNTLYIYFNVDSKANNIKVKALVDNITVEQVSAPAAVFNKMNGEGVTLVTGKAGDSITYPQEPVLFGNDFSGWYSDNEQTVPFTESAFSSEQVFCAYASYVNSKTVVYDFEHYLIGEEKETGFVQRLTADPVKKSFAYSGKTVVEIDRGRKDRNVAGSGLLIANGFKGAQIQPDRYYIVKFKFRIAEHGERALNVDLRASSQNNFWGGALVSSSYVIDKNFDVGKWHTGTLVVNGAKMKTASKNYLYLWAAQGDNGIYYFDDITIETLDEDVMAYYIDNGGCANVPEYVTGKMGQSFASQLPKNPKYANHNFLGYYYLGDDGKYQKFTKMVFTKDEPKVEARFIRIKTIQNFEDNFKRELDRFPSYGQMDFDYKLYDSSAQGSSKENVSGGRYSLQRQGKTQFFENAQVLTETTQLVAGEKYTVTFKVKLASYLHTDGAIKIVSNNSARFAWATMGDYHATVAIEDLTDGKWHTVSYTFIAVENYVSFQTPGYCELYIDDITFTYVNKNTPVSSSVKFTEYVPAKRDLTTGEIIEEEANAIDVSTIIDPNIGNFANALGLNPVLVWVAGGVVVLAAAALVLIVIVKKRKKKVKGE